MSAARVTVYRGGLAVHRARFESERDLFLWLEARGVTYYPEIGETHLADGSSYEYGKDAL